MPNKLKDVFDRPFVILESKNGEDRLNGFRYWWLKYVRGFDPKNHCAKCLIGQYSKHVSVKWPVGDIVYLDDEAKDFSHIYLCGVSYRGYDNNFHLAMQIDPIAKPQACETYNGYRVITNGVRKLDIPALPDGWNGYTKEFTTCRNFQFAVEHLGSNTR